jgi:hypothetical protein
MTIVATLVMVEKNMHFNTSGGLDQIAVGGHEVQSLLKTFDSHLRWQLPRNCA